MEIKMKRRNIIKLTFLLFLLQSCAYSPFKSLGDKQVNVFANEQVNWGHAQAGNTLQANEKGIIRLTGGRILLKKITLPRYQKSTKVSARLRLVSNGDPWDKSGSLFVLPNKSVANLLNIQQKQQKFPDFKVGSENYPGVAIIDNYQPTMELIRFMTPFGVGFFSDSPKLDQRKPVYIDKWAKEVVWQQDISDRIEQLHGEVWIGIWIDVWTKEGYKVDLDLDFDETEFDQQKITKAWSMPLVNTINYFGPMKYPDFFSRNSLKVNFNLPDNIENLKLKYIVTGHGGHAGGDEFVKKRNVISIDGLTRHSFIPWIDHCAAFRRFNPHSGVWTEKTRWQDKEIEERIASSDYSRSNWCPGSQVLPVEIPLTQLTAGEHTLTIDIPEAQAIKDNELNHWLISAYLVGEISQNIVSE